VRQTRREGESVGHERQSRHAVTEAEARKQAAAMLEEAGVALTP
jgi:hypothetical protein